MPGLGFQDLRSGSRARDISPDSVIFTGESNFSLFSSASGSVERSSSASDVPDQISLVSQVSQHLTGRGFSEGSSGPDPDPNRSTLVHKKSVNLIRKEKAKVLLHKLDSSEAETTEDEYIAIVSARNSFSKALKECQDRRLRSEVILNKADRRRPASLDLNNSLINATNSSSPRFGAMKKPSITTKRINAFPSPGTPNYRNASFGLQKGWSSERIPPDINRRNVTNALLPYNNNGRTLPSKWEDAERWIFSPMSGDGALKTSLQQQKGRPKSKSGPLGPPGVAYHQMFSPATTPMFDGGQNGKLIANSPFLAGDGMSVSYGACEGSGNFHMKAEPCMARSISIHGCSEMLRQSSLHGQIEEKYDETEDESNNVSRTVSRRDMATQMSPESSSIHSSSPKRQSSLSLANSIIDLQNIMSSSRTEIRNVTIDERVSMTRWSKNVKTPQRSSSNSSASWREISSDSSKSISKIRREEAKITAWENLQKAKAEAAIKKLEMKLEKRRSSSMDKIMKKLKSAQKKAQEMRSSELSNQNQPRNSGRSSKKSLPFRSRTPQIGSLSGCFTCHAFTTS